MDLCSRVTSWSLIMHSFRFPAVGERGIAVTTKLCWLLWINSYPPVWRVQTAARSEYFLPCGISLFGNCIVSPGVIYDTEWLVDGCHMSQVNGHVWWIMTKLGHISKTWIFWKQRHFLCLHFLPNMQTTLEQSTVGCLSLWANLI